jgi:hypothetical protein
LRVPAWNNSAAKTFGVAMAGGTTMAQFKRLTLCDDGEHPIDVNVDNVLYVRRGGHSTTIFFSQEHRVSVKETPDQIRAVDGARS